MSQTLSPIVQPLPLKELSIVAWRIRKTRASIHENQVHRQIMDQLHEENTLN